MPEEPGNPEANKPNPNKVVQGLLAKLALPTPPPAEVWDAAEGGVRETEVQAHAIDVTAPHPTSPPAPASSQALAFAGVGGSLEVDCRPCGGCGRWRRGVRLPGRVYGLVAWVAGLLGVPMCRVVNEVPELLGVRVRRGGGVKARERELS
ncbi:MAG: hypothetical protein RXN91_06300, partial [Caldivirga sp.]